MTERAYFAVAGLVAVVAASLIWFSTLLGPGSTPDSLQYLFASQDILEGKSLAALPRHWPPGYPLLLALPLSMGLDPAMALRVLHALIALLNVLLFSACVRPSSGAPAAVSLLATSFFALAPGVQAVSIMAWSEPPFLALLMSALLALRMFLSRSSMTALVAVGLFLGAALFTRYAAISFVLSVAISVAMLRWRSDRPAAVLQGGLIVVLAILPLALWLFCPSEAAVSAAPRSLVFHPVDLPRLLGGAAVIAEWFQAGLLGVVPAACVGVGSLFLVLLSLRASAPSDADSKFVGICLFSVLCYFAFLVVSISFFDYYTPLDLRILWPALILFAVATGVAASRVSAAGGRHLVASSCIFALPLLAGLPSLSVAVSVNMREARGYFSPSLQAMPVLAVVRGLPQIKLYSNAPELLRLNSGRMAHMLPAAYDMVRNMPTMDYIPKMNELMVEVRDGRAAVVYISAFRWRNYLPDQSAFGDAGVGAPLYEGPDGWVIASAR